MGPLTKAKEIGAHEAFSDFIACVPREISSGGKGVELIRFKINESSF